MKTQAQLSLPQYARMRRVAAVLLHVAKPLSTSDLQRISLALRCVNRTLLFELSRAVLVWLHNLTTQKWTYRFSRVPALCSLSSAAGRSLLPLFPPVKDIVSVNEWQRGAVAQFFTVTYTTKSMAYKVVPTGSPGANTQAAGAQATKKARFALTETGVVVPL